jgi:hypothetical protein
LCAPCFVSNTSCSCELPQVIMIMLFSWCLRFLFSAKQQLALHAVATRRKPRCCMHVMACIFYLCLSAPSCTAAQEHSTHVHPIQSMPACIVQSMPGCMWLLWASTRRKASNSADVYTSTPLWCQHCIMLMPYIFFSFKSQHIVQISI